MVQILTDLFNLQVADGANHDQIQSKKCQFCTNLIYVFLTFDRVVLKKKKCENDVFK